MPQRKLSMVTLAIGLLWQVNKSPKPQLCIKFKTTLGYVRPCLKTNNQMKKIPKALIFSIIHLFLQHEEKLNIKHK